MAVHSCLKNEFMEEEKYHSLVTWLISFPGIWQPGVGGRVYSRSLEDSTRQTRHSGTEAEDSEENTAVG